MLRVEATTLPMWVYDLTTCRGVLAPLRAEDDGAVVNQTGPTMDRLAALPGPANERLCLGMTEVWAEADRPEGIVEQACRMSELGGHVRSSAHERESSVVCQTKIGNRSDS